MLAVYTGSALASLAPVAKNDDAAGVCGAGTAQSAISFDAVAGTEYRIAIDGYNNGSGPARGELGLSLVNVVVTPPLPPAPPPAPDSDDEMAPETSIVGAPASRLKVRRKAVVSFRFDSSEKGSRFECSLQGDAFAACSSPQSYAGLRPGKYGFRVRAVDASGNADPTAAGYRFKVKRKRRR